MLWHGWLSAFAFTALLFFSATGLLLNHPEWLEPTPPKTIEKILVLSQEELARFSTDDQGLRAMASYLTGITPVYGAFRQGSVEDGHAVLHLESVRGRTSFKVNLLSGKVNVKVLKAGVVALMNGLHRGGESASQWRALIDVAAIALLAFSILGYILFFTVSSGLKKSLWITAGGLAAIVFVFFVFVP